MRPNEADRDLAEEIHDLPPCPTGQEELENIAILVAGHREAERERVLGLLHDWLNKGHSLSSHEATEFLVEACDFVTDLKNP